MIKNFLGPMNQNPHMQYNAKVEMSEEKTLSTFKSH